MAETEAVFVYTTWPSPGAAAAVGAALVEARLAAAVNIIAGVASIYRWRGAVERAEETIMVIKTVRGRSEQVIAEVTRRHPYDEPGIAVVPLAGGSPGYLDWIRRESSD